MPEVEVAGAAVAYRETGRGETVIALHSSASSGKQWDALGELLAGAARGAATRCLV